MAFDILGHCLHLAVFADYRRLALFAGCAEAGSSADSRLPCPKFLPRFDVLSSAPRHSQELPVSQGSSQREGRLDRILWRTGPEKVDWVQNIAHADEYIYDSGCRHRHVELEAAQ